MIECARSATERQDGSPEPLRQAHKRQDAGEKHQRTALEAPWRAHTEKLPHEQPEIQAAGMDQQTFEDVA